MKLLQFLIAACFVFIVGTSTAFSQSISDNFKKAAKGDSEAMYILGLAYLTGTGVEQNERMASHWFEESAKKGNVDAMSKLGTMYLNNGNYSEALKLLKQASSKGDIASIYRLGLYYQFIEKDNEQAFKYYKSAAEKGFSKAMSKLAWCYYYNRGVLDRNHCTLSLEWGRKAAEAKNSEGMYFLSVYYSENDCQDTDYSMAQEWFYKAVENKNAKACYYAIFQTEDIEQRKQLCMTCFDALQRGDTDYSLIESEEMKMNVVQEFERIGGFDE